MPKAIVLPMEAKHLYETGQMSELALSLRFGVSRPVIARHLLEWGVEKRSLSNLQSARNSRLSADERKRNVAAANAAVRGRKVSTSEKCKRALTIQSKARMSSHEKVVFDELAKLGIDSIPQMAIGPHNVDLGLPAHGLVIEVGCNWHVERSSGDSAKRASLIRRGWVVLEIWPKFNLESSMRVLSQWCR